MTVAEAKARLREVAEQCTLTTLVGKTTLGSIATAASLGLAAGSVGGLPGLAIKGLRWGLQWWFSGRGKGEEEED
jgi:hypothetical protein